MKLTRRDLMLGVAAAALTCGSPVSLAMAGVGFPSRARPLPLGDVRLRPSDYATAVEVNHGYLMSLSADRFLHNFRKYAGLEPKAEIYGGWESDTIAGHTLGHYMSALVLMWQQTGSRECRERCDYIVDELAEAQKARGNGYVGALGRKTKDGNIVDGIEIFDEIRSGHVKSGGFDLNGSWSPFYTVHKLFAGLLDAHAAWGNALALDVAVRLGNYFADFFAALDDNRLQEVLACEYGGINESFAELADRTGDTRWMALAERIYDHRSLDPLFAGEDKLANFHANTQVPKLIGLARIHELTGKKAPAEAARFFWETVTNHHSYVIGGNSDREYFSQPDTIAEHVTEQTCEHCNSYNMLKLTRQLYSWEPDGRLFDYYERTHLNHVMSAQHPATGGFTYMTPLMSGTAREYSSPTEDTFWCCVGSGIESHSKHGDSIFWEGDGTLFVNLYIPADAEWKAKGAAFTLDTAYPFEGDARLTFTQVGRSAPFTVALRIPGWANGMFDIKVNGKPEKASVQNGYALVRRSWHKGDTVALSLPLELRMESAPGDKDMVSLLRGPLVLSADLGSKEMEWTGVDPALVSTAPLASLTAIDASRALYRSNGSIRPYDLNFVPFYRQYDRRSATYFRRFTEARWQTEEAAFMAAQVRARDIAARSVDVMHLGEMQPERDHKLVSEISYPVTYRGKNGRDARSGGYFEFTMQVKPGPLVLQATYWGSERNRSFDILIDGKKLATQMLNDDQPGKFFDVEYKVDEAFTAGKSSVRVKFLPHDRHTAGPVFGVRLFTAGKGSAT